VEERTKTIRKQRIGVYVLQIRNSLYVVICQLFGVHNSTHHYRPFARATTAFIGALGSFLIGVITAFVNTQNSKTDIVKLETDTEIE
jgi:hypothetical protein